ncbi:MAG: T9SS type A sorting domain-containing protein [Saprospiraceae bacterium]|nr:MAG: T9SS type A sorting domain-containing protein [Saprospiraceae bacterium]
MFYVTNKILAMKNFLHYLLLAALLLLAAGPHFSFIKNGKAVATLFSGRVHNDPTYDLVENYLFPCLTISPGAQFGTGAGKEDVAHPTSPKCPETPADFSLNLSTHPSSLVASKCDSLSVFVEQLHTIPPNCCSLLFFDNQVDSCFTQIHLQLNSATFTGLSVDNFNGWSVSQPNAGELVLTHNSGFIPVGFFQNALSWCVTGGSNPDTLTVNFQYAANGAIATCDTSFVFSCPVVDVCPGNIVQNGSFELGTPNGNDESISLATNWSGIWTGGSTGDFYNTVSPLPPGTPPLPLSQSNFSSFWCRLQANQPVWREGIMNQLGAAIAQNSGCYQLSLKLACLGFYFGTPGVSVFGVPVGAASTGTPGALAPTNPNLFSPPAILLGTYAIPGTCDENFQTISFNFNSSALPAAGIDRIFITRTDSAFGGVYIAVDDVCLAPAECSHDSCCADFDAFCNLVNQGFTVAIGDSCKVTVTAPQFDSCHWFGTPPDFGDGTPVLQVLVPANGMWMHTYAQSGTYNICVTVYEQNGSGDFCWYKQMCTPVTVNCGCDTATIVLNTGWDNQNSTVINTPGMDVDNAPDLDWWVIADPVTTIPTPRPADVIAPAHPLWALPFSNSQWISACPLGCNGQLPGTPQQFTYEVCFNLPPGFSDANLSLQLRADEVIDEVWLGSNNIYTVPTYPPYPATGGFAGPPLIITDGMQSHFAAGQNCLMVKYSDITGAVTGLNVAGGVTYCPFPCDSLWVTKDSLDSDSCCYSMNFGIHAAPIQFIQVESLTPGVGFSNASISPSGLLLDGGPAGTLLTIHTTPHASIPLGDYPGLLQFCLSNITNASQVPQCVVIRWYSGPNAFDGADLVCTDTLCFFCPVACCQDYEAFVQNVQNAVSITIVDSLCKAAVNIGTLPECDSFEYVDWGDGNTDYGPFGVGAMIMHTYSQSGTYVISYLAIERDPNTGLICFEKFLTDTITLNCECHCGDWNLNFNYAGIATPVDCGDTMYFECPPIVGAIITGSFSCLEDSCLAAPINWQLTGPNNSITGITSPGNIFITLPSPFLAGWYSLSMSTICGSDTCVCNLAWFQNECPVDSCCLDYELFVQNVQNAVSITIVDSLCKAILTVSGLPPCDSITYIDWGDGNLDFGPYADGMYMHTYAQTGSYIINLGAVEYSSPGHACFDLGLSVAFDVDCTGTPAGEIEELSAPKIFPNPVSGQLYVVLPVPGEWTAELWSFDGKQVLQQHRPPEAETPWPLNLGGLPSGVYLVVLKNGGPNGWVWRERIVKM